MIAQFLFGFRISSFPIFKNKLSPEDLDRTEHFSIVPINQQRGIHQHKMN